MHNFIRNTLVLLSIVFFSCQKKDERAGLHLNIARKYYHEKEYTKAKQELDSLHRKYPKALEERHAALALLDSVRRGENRQTINRCDSLIALHIPDLEKVKNQFSFQKNKEYQAKGVYIPKESAGDGTITGITLRPGVEENGNLFLESIFTGENQKHNRIKVATKDGSYAETLPENGDGLNYRFSNMGKQYEVIRFTETKENGVAKFIFVNSDKPLTITLTGQNKYSYTLSPNVKSAVSKSFQLSTMMHRLDSLKSAKEQAEFFNYELDKKKNENAEGLAK